MSEKVNIHDAKRQTAVARKPGRLRGRIRVRPTFEDPIPSNLFPEAGPTPATRS